MGIKYLNRYLLKNCSKEAIHSIHLSSMQNQTIVIDTSIYIYKFLEEELLLENFKILIDILVKYNVTPIFVFDGKPPIEKKELLLQRQEMKKNAEIRYNEILKEKTSPNNVVLLNSLKKKFIRINDQNIIKIKNLMTLNNIEFINAIGESDTVCFDYVKTKKAWACLSDDMDLFVYGCNRVIRDLSLHNETVNLYVLPEILYDLKLTMTSFRDILVISGTDYNLYDSTDNICLHETFKWYKLYKSYCINQKKCYQIRPIDSFYQWLFNNTKYIKNYEKLLKVHRLFVV
jgi:hypothetical protein